MRIRKPILLATIILLISCNPHPEVSVVYSVGPKVMEAKGYVVPQDSIAEPAVTFIDNQKLRRQSLGRPEIIRTHNNIHVVGKPNVVIAGTPRVTTPGQDTFAILIPIPVKGHQVIGSMPEVVNAKDPYTKDQNPENFSSFSKKQGMKNAFVGNIIEDTMGNLWISHGGGVSKYDGKTFTHFGKKEGLSDNAVACMLEDKEGNLWFGTNVGGVTRYDGKTFTNFSKADGLTDNTVLVILQDKDDNFWFGTEDGATKYDGENFTRFTTREGLLHNQINDILEDKHGNLWFASEEGVSRFDGTSFTHFTEKEGLSNKIVNSIIEDHAGNLWFGTFGGGLNKYNGQTFMHFTEKEGLLDNLVFTILQDHQGYLWIGTNSGIIKYDGEYILTSQQESVRDTSNPLQATFTNYTEREGLSNPFVNSIIEDQFGNIWIATNGGGLNKYNGKTFTHFTDKEGLAGNEVAAIMQNEDGHFWLGSSGGISLYDGHSFTNFTVNEASSNTYIRVILKGQANNLWLGTNGSGIKKYTPPQNDAPGTITYLMETEGAFDKIILSMLKDRDGNIWFGTIDGVYRYNESAKPDTKSTLTLFTEREGISNNMVHCILEDRAGNIWFGTQGGITKYESPTSDAPASFTHFSEKEGFSGNIVRSMLEDHAGNIWFGTEADGVAKYSPAHDGHPSSFTFLTDKEGLCSNAVLSILEDRDRNLWFGTRMGLSILTTKKLAELSDKVKSGNFQESDVFFKNYTYENGFLGVGCTVNSILEDKDGTVWIGANDRLTLCHPMVKDTAFDHIAPTIQLTGISLFSELIAWTSLEHHQDSALKLGNGVTIKNFRFDNTSKWYGLPENLSLAYNNNYVSFNYVGITMNQPKKVKYQYILEGNDDHWSAVTLRTEAAYGNLSHGAYTFKVKAMNAEGYWSDVITFPFIIRAPWWLTWWAYGLYMLMLLALVYYTQLFQKKRIVHAEREKANQKQAILNERLRISQDLHDEVGATLSGISMYSHIAKEQIKAEHQSGLLNSLSIMQESSGEMVNKLNDIVWLLNPDQAQLQQLVEKLEDYARQMGEAKAIRVHVDITDRISTIELPIEVRRNTYLIFKEAINNCIKYSQGTNLSLTVTNQANKLEFVLQDDGVGFEPAIIKKGNGLLNMQKRADEIGSLLHIESIPDKGTRLSLTYSLPS